MRVSLVCLSVNGYVDAEGLFYFGEDTDIY